MFDPKVHVGVGARLTRTTDKGLEVLVMHRSADATHGADTWALPGGWIDWGQTPEEAAARELLEELNISAQASDGTLVGAVANTYPDHDMHIVCIGIHFDSYDASRLTNMEPEKCDAVAWVPVSKLGNIPLFPPLESLARAWGWL